MQTIQTVMQSLGITAQAMKPQVTYHPLDPLSAQELQECVNIVGQANGISGAVPGQGDRTVRTTQKCASPLPR
jgi:Cu2+-containing amine oxidase